jgi:uncharacterized protein
LRLVIDTNVLVSALFSSTSLPAHLITLWRQGLFDLLTSADQLEELIRVARGLRDLAILVKSLPVVTVSPDPYDNYLLATAAAGAADFLVTGDKRDILPLGRYAGAKIVTVRQFLILSRRLP